MTTLAAVERPLVIAVRGTTTGSMLFHGDVVDHAAERASAGKAPHETTGRPHNRAWVPRTEREIEMRILAIERTVEGVTEARFTPELAAAEAQRAWELQQAGTIRDLYFRADESSAVLMLECEDAAAARAVLASHRSWPPA
jgi:hypothetical protein